ncbi:MAG TPA: Fic family protein [Acidimicrobiales bacterium]|nr:Fic family protein [Acidimicrobiales bacterium]
MIFNPPADLETELRAIEAIDGLRRQLRWRVVEEPHRWQGGLRRLTFAKAVQGSNSIEGYNASVDDVIAVVEDEETVDAPIETRLALQGYRDALTYVLQLADEDPLAIDQSLLKALHYMMLKHDLGKRPGRWRTGDVFIRREPIGEIVYEAPDAPVVPTLVDEVLDCLGASDGPVLVRAAMAHLNLTMIHPFKDGNGRMARCLQTLVLSREKILSPVFSSIEEEIGRDSAAYYAALAEVGRGSWHPRHDARPWIRFCLNAHYRQARRVLRRVREIEETWSRCEDLVQRLDAPARAVGPLCDASRGLTVRNWSYRLAVAESEGNEVDSATASRDLRLLVEKGLLEAHGENRGRHYRATATLSAVRQAVRRAHPQEPDVDLFSEGVELAPTTGHRTVFRTGSTLPEGPAVDPIVRPPVVPVVMTEEPKPLP